MNEQIFRIRPYSKRELAGLYFPFTKNADTAVKNLNNLMHRNPDLLAELAEAVTPHTPGYSHLCRCASSCVIWESLDKSTLRLPEAV